MSRRAFAIFELGNARAIHARPLLPHSRAVACLHDAAIPAGVDNFLGVVYVACCPPRPSCRRRSEHAKLTKATRGGAPGRETIESCSTQSGNLIRTRAPSATLPKNRCFEFADHGQVQRPVSLVPYWACLSS
jgi:hypothetical protein